jgi:uncharacterized protein (TIGR03435 family)
MANVTHRLFCVVGVLASLALVFAESSVSGQANREKPTLPIEGPQGIGIRAAPVPPDAPRFDVVSVKRDLSGVMPPSSQGQLVNVRANRLTAFNITVRELIRNAYNLQHVPRSFVVDGPEWIDSERYNVEAVVEKPFEAQRVRNVPPPSAAAMIRSLLVDRFHLQVHNETREREVLELVLDRADRRLGPGLKPSQAKCLGPFDLVDLDTTNRAIFPTEDPRPYFCPFGYFYGPTSRMQASQMRMRDIAMFFGLIASVNMGVVDRTGVDGRYDIDLTFAGDVILSPNAAPVPREVGATDALPLRAAIRQQLGLRLEQTRAQVEVLVIDHVERPTEN